MINKDDIWETVNKKNINLILIRGIPGSGKSTLANMLILSYFSKAIHLEADMFFIDNNGIYNFNKDSLHKAHEWCQNSAKIFLNHNKTVIVSNTFTKLWELTNYLTLSKSNLVIRCTGQFKNIHNVPDEVLNNMKNRFEDYPGEIIV